MKVKGTSVELHHDDLPAGAIDAESVAVDTETTGLNPMRDRLCLIQLSAGDGTCHLVQFAGGSYRAPNLKALLGDQAVTKMFHYARFDLMMIRRFLGVACRPVYCTKIASRLVRTYTDRHGLKDLCREMLGVEMAKKQQSSDWAAATLTKDQLGYAAADVLHLHALRDKLDAMLEREGRAELADACFRFLDCRAELDLGGWFEVDIFAH